MDDGAGGTTSSAHIVIGSTQALCSDAGASPPIDREGEHLVVLDLRDVSGSTIAAPSAPGAYTIYPDTGSEPPHSASRAVDTLDTACQPIDSSAAAAQSGTVTLTTVANGAFSGSYDVTLNNGNHLTGNFAAQACGALQSAATSQTTHQCSP